MPSNPIPPEVVAVVVSELVKTKPAKTAAKELKKKAKKALKKLKFW
jgi:hypothetical protein